MSRGKAGHPRRAALFLADEERARWHDQALWFVRAKRDTAAQEVPEWEILRQTAQRIKEHTISRLAGYLEEFEANAERCGAQVHWATDATEHNRIVHAILAQRGLRKVVKSKSMLTEECGLNAYLEGKGVDVIDTDLGERIVQLRGEGPSHIVLPAIHLRKSEVGGLFEERLGTRAGASDPSYLTEAARSHLRDKFLAAEVGITGVNFGIAETGGVVVCTNEGNADLGVSLPRVHIACMGIEKIIPRAKDLGVFLRLLARSATGQPITSYTSHFHGPAPGGELHIVLVDSGRTDLRCEPTFRRSLGCIRCGACLNTCPVYRRSGGFSYSTPIPGPIGSILAPQGDARVHWTLPYACSLCGSCTDVCPVEIDLHDQLLASRKQIVALKLLPWRKRAGMKLLSIALRRASIYALLGRAARALGRWLPRPLVYSSFNVWGRRRELPPLPKRSFRELYLERKDKQGTNTRSTEK